MLVPQIPRNLPLFSTFICISSRANLGNQRFPVAFHWTHLTFLWETTLSLAEQSKSSGRHRGHSRSPAAAPAPLGLECDRTLSLQQLPLPEPLALTGTKVMPGAFPASLQPPQHHQTTLCVLQEVQRQQQTWLNSSFISLSSSQRVSSTNNLVILYFNKFNTRGLH